MSVIRIIVGSTRPVRVGDQLASALAPLLASATGAEVETVDLRQLALPMLDEPRMPALGGYAHDHTKEWSALVEESDALVFLTPQYNGGYPASLKECDRLPVRRMARQAGPPGQLWRPWWGNGGRAVGTRTRFRRRGSDRSAGGSHPRPGRLRPRWAAGRPQRPIEEVAGDVRRAARELADKLALVPAT